MAVSACNGWLNTNFNVCKEEAKKVYDSFTTDKYVPLVSAAILNGGIALMVSLTALKTEHYNPREWWSDVAVHALNFVTCMTIATMPDNSSEAAKSMLVIATAITILANKARLAGIAVSVAYNTQTIPRILEAIDFGLHFFTAALLDKIGPKEKQMKMT